MQAHPGPSTLDVHVLDAHLDRLFEGAKAIALDIGMDRAALSAAIHDTLRGNGMQDGVHIRLMVTRGIKRTPYQDPRVCIGPATVVIIPEYKNPLPEVLDRGLKLFTVHVRRGYPDVQDPKLNSHSKLNCITACIQAYTAGADEALAQIRGALKGELSSNIQDYGTSVLETWYCPLRDGAGRNFAAASISTDITEREQARCDLADRQYTTDAHNNA